VWAPRADHRRPTRPELAAARAKDDWERGWGRVSIRSRRRSVDLASKIKEKKVKKPAKNHPVDDTLARPLSHRRHIEMNNPSKMKEITKKSKKQATITQKS